MKNLFFITIVAFAIIACRNRNLQKDINNPTNIPKIDTISYELKSISKEFGDCGENPSKCTKADIKYVILNNKSNLSNFSKINSLIEKPIRGNAPNVDAAIDSFMIEAKIFYEEVPEAPGGYAMEIGQNVIFNDTKILAIEEFSYSFTGGAHGNFGTGFYNFDVTNGQQIRLKDILVEGYETSLKNIAEPIFKKAYLEEGMTNYSDAGFYFEEDIFTMTDNFAITKEGLKFIYNPYEIGPYVMGQQEIIIPFSSLKDLIKKDGLLAKF